MIIPILMIFTSYRNLPNFYLSSTALSSSLINSLYLFYLIKTINAKNFSEINCRAIYYLQTSCIIVLSYTIAAMHATFVLSLFPSSSLTNDQSHSIRHCLHSCGIYLRRLFRRFCFCLVLIVWSLSFTSAVPLLYTVDSNEKQLKSVYCPGTKELTYLEELFDRNRFIQTILCNLIPFLICLFLSLIALLKLFYDSIIYLYIRLKMSNCFLFRNQYLSSNIIIQSYKQWFTISFLRFILILSCCLLACIYPIVMRFYLIYFSVLIPLIFGIFNYVLGQLILPEQQNEINQENFFSSIKQNSFNKIFQINDCTNEQIELRSPSIANLLINNEQPSPNISIISSNPQQQQQRRLSFKFKGLSFANHLYENTQNVCVK